MKLNKIKLWLLRKALGHIPLSSYPYMSGDTFRSQCHFTLTDNFINQLENITGDLQGYSIFCDTSRARDLADHLLGVDIPRFIRLILVIHNGDEIPTLNEFEILQFHFSKIYCVNWLGDPEVITPIPIGLENRNYFQNGIPKDFALAQKCRRNQMRANSILANFSLATNFPERGAALAYALDSKFEVITSRYSNQREYLNVLGNTKYVLSPPGNGPDCHRTWEAMYMGAIPIVKRKFWPFSHLTDLPVIVIEDWHEIEAAISKFESDSKKPDFDWQGYFNSILNPRNIL
jgi:hypothetical protein